MAACCVLLSIEGLNDQDSILSLLRQHGSLGFSPVKATADSSLFIIVDDFFWQCQCVTLSTQWEKGFHPWLFLDEDLRQSFIQILTATWNRIRQRDTVVDINQRD